MDLLLEFLPFASVATHIKMIETLRALLIATNKYDDITARRCEDVLAKLRRHALKKAA